MNTAELQSAGLHHKGTVGGLMSAAETWTKRISRRQQFRQTFLPLLEERDQILSDIGYSRFDIHRALRLPLRQDAMEYMEAKRQFHQKQAS
ncbi:hypothetical protein [Marinobacter sp. CHS3-4]|uniref:hypothetical protein n=1 Tax=Marinobacter sp. CHS3-4 TaxID=3045174 RepID=UPI0024B599EC|nr:hypothetical protein [Marinobacter sp. CHS3-4]MDI9245393.1 hypothetical protein [Marinobacter sp. CHS3-4]